MNLIQNAVFEQYLSLQNRTYTALQKNEIDTKPQLEFTRVGQNFWMRCLYNSVCTLG